jgi:hypothetical protein
MGSTEGHDGPVGPARTKPDRLVIDNVIKAASVYIKVHRKAARRLKHDLIGVAKLALHPHQTQQELLISA